MHSIVITLHF